MSFKGYTFEVVPKYQKRWFKPDRTLYNVVRRGEYSYVYDHHDTKTIYKDEVLFVAETLDEAVKMRLKYRTEEIV